MSDHGHAHELDSALDHFEQTLLKRWRDVVHDSVFDLTEIPWPLSGRGELWEHRRAEVFGHVSYSQNYGGCAYLNWYRNGCQGKVQSITCDGKIREEQHYDLETIEWEGVETEVPFFIQCRIGDLFAAAEDWCRKDRRQISDALPPFATHDLTALEEARNALVSMAGDFGGTPAAGGATEDAALRTGLTLTDTVDLIVVDRDRDRTAGWPANGIFASTRPTLFNHAIIANGLGTLINERATIIHTYRQNSLNLVRSATAALGATTPDHVNEWESVRGLGMALSIAPAAAPYGAAIALVGWLGAQFLKESTSVSFSHTPQEAARNLYDAAMAMVEGLTCSEAAYAQDVREFRDALNAVPSTFLELDDISENKVASP